MAFINGQEILFSPELHISSVEVVQTTGESESAVMSQKSVTEELGQRDSAINRNDNRITNLEQRIDPSLFTTDNSVAYIKDVPENALPYAEISEIGGMTRKCNNLIKFPYVSSSTTMNGVTFTINDDGSITVNGTATAGTTYPLWYPSNSEIWGGETYTVSGGTSSIALTARKTTSSGANSSWIDSIGTARTGSLSVDEKLASVALYISGGASVNATIYPMLNIGSVALPYEPYFGGLRNATVTEIKSKGANLIPYPYATGSVTTNGVTITVHDDGFIQFEGTCTAAFEYYIARNLPISSSTCAVGQGIEYATNGEICVSKHNNTLGNYASLAYYTWSGGVVVSYLQAGVTYTGGFYPMINYGTTVVPYKPYVDQVDTFAIPEVVQSLPGYGLGVNATYYNKIVLDIDNGIKEFRANCEKYVVDGSIGDWYGSGGYKNCWVVYYKNLYGKKIMDGIASNYKSLSSSEFLNGTANGAYHRISEQLIIRDARFTDKTTTQAILSANPIEVVLGFSETNTTDISKYFVKDNFIKVESGGSIVAENEFGYDVASKITYQVEV